MMHGTINIKLFKTVTVVELQSKEYVICGVFFTKLCTFVRLILSCSYGLKLV